MLDQPMKQKFTVIEDIFSKGKMKINVHEKTHIVRPH